jgi:hypothetical protein
MPTLQEIINRATEPEPWYDEVLEEVVRGIEERVEDFMSGGKGSVTVSIKDPDRLVGHQTRLKRYLESKLDADVRVEVNSSPKDGRWADIEVAKKGHFAALSDAYWRK